jgi:diguanylate cyclase (GGDEF)-like protein/PAS domain S-box-containing protein
MLTALMSILRKCPTKAEQLNPRVAARVAVEQMDVSLRLVPFTVATSFSVVEVIVWLFWAPGARAYLTLLQVSLITLAFATLLRCYLWRKRPKPASISPLEFGAALAVAQLYGWTLASLPWMLFAGASPNGRLLIAASCAGLIATGMSMAVMPRVAIQFSGPIVIGSFAALAATKDPEYYYVAILLVFYGAFLLITVRRLSRLVTNWVMAQAELQRQQELTNLLLNDFEEGASDWLWETDSELRLQHVSPRLSEVAGVSIRGLQNLSLSELFPIEVELSGLNEQLWVQINDRRAFANVLFPIRIDGELHWWSLSGRPIFEPEGAFSGYRGVGSDVTEKKRSEEQLSYLAMHDPLTGLPNRAFFQEELAKAGRRFEAGHDFAVLCLDLDHFKIINDTYGHSVGDALLQMVAERLKALMGAGAFVARLAGDEFVLLLTNSTETNTKDVGALAARIVDLLRDPFQIGEFTARIGASIGVAIASETGPNDIMRLADLALYRVKHSGGGAYRFYEAEMDARIEARRALAADLRGALERGEFFLNFQPLISATTLRTEGFEALARWRHPQRGLIPPTEFIQLAEESGMIITIGEWILKEACRVASLLPPHINVAVNISPIQFRHSNLVRVVRSALEETGLSPHRLEIEVTESVFLEATPTTHAIFRRLRARGVRLSLDDFGTGYSSLSYLRRGTFDKIKIDSTFVRGLPHEASDVAIVRAIVDIASTLGMTVTAEGVETNEQSFLLRQFGCHQLQGYLFSKPLSADAAIVYARTVVGAPSAAA